MPPPKFKLYAVEPVGVDTKSPSPVNLSSKLLFTNTSNFKSFKSDERTTISFKE